jgi:hypothetical protein
MKRLASSRLIAAVATMTGLTVESIEAEAKLRRPRGIPLRTARG